MNHELLKKFSPSAQRALKLLAKSPQDAKHFHDRLIVTHAALMLGREVVEQAVRENPGDQLAGVKAGIATTLIAVTTGLECTMQLLKELHPGELGEVNLSDPKSPLPSLDPTKHDPNRIRRIDTD